VSTTNDKALAVCQELHSSDTVPESVLRGSAMGTASFDPAIIGTIAQFLVKLIQMFVGCGKTPAQAVAMARKPTVGNHVRLRWQARRHLRQHPELAAYPDQLADGVIAVGETVTTGDFKQMYSEIPDDPKEVQ
jgi:hypothetical protein